MITSIAQYMASYLAENDIIKRDKLDIYIYGFELIISNLICISITIALGLAFSQLYEALLFLILFIILRRYCGGYHAQTYFKCNVVFTINILLVMVSLKFIGKVDIYIHLLIISLCLLTVAKLAPIENKHKPITADERKKHRLTAVVIVIILSIFVLAFVYILEKFSIVIDLVFLSITISMLIEYSRKGGDLNEGYEKNCS